jgi:hydrogenase-1 operon protein HyaF
MTHTTDTTDTECLQVTVGDSLTYNVVPLLHEIRHALAKLLDDGGHTVIDLRSIPLAPGEEEKLLATLGRGEIVAQLSALGPSEILETRFPGVWLVTHYNNDNEVIGKFIEVCRLPRILQALDEDIRDAIDNLEAQLAQQTGDQ